MVGCPKAGAYTASAAASACLRAICQLFSGRRISMEIQPLWPDWASQWAMALCSGSGIPQKKVNRLSHTLLVVIAECLLTASLGLCLNNLNIEKELKNEFRIC